MKKVAFKLGDRILQSLCASDEKMALLINKIGDYELNLRTDYFPSLVRSIIGQQLSAKAARTIWERTKNLCNSVSPEVLAQTREDDLRSAGISRKKTCYIKNLSEMVLNGEINLTQFSSLPDNEVISQLVKVKGIGIWTAEMFLIFSLGRLDILSLGDQGLKRAILWLYGLKKTPAEKALKLYAEKWSPYRTVASLYLWEIINRGFLKEDPHILKPV